VTNPDGITNLHDNFLRGRQISGDKPFLGVRPVFNGLAGSFQWESYNKVYEHMKNFGSGLIQLGAKAKENVGLYSVNRPGWVIAEHACYMYDFVTVPLYDTLGDEALEYIIQLTDMKYVVLTANKIANLIAVRSKIPKLKTLIIMDHSHITPEIKEKSSQVGFELIAFDEVKKVGSQNVKERATTGLDTIATICFTSGTTGLPKGALISHGNLLSFIAAYHALAAKNYQPEYNSEDSYLSFLPLAHIFERVVQATLVNVGARIGFYQGDTLKLLDDVGELRPTVFVAVPRLFNRIYEKVNETIRAGGGLKKKLFDHAFAVKKANLQRGTVTHSLWDAIVFKKIRNRLGGRVRSIITGSAPISPDVMDFLRICFSSTVIEGYGQTESTGGTCVTHLADLTAGHVGSPFPNCMIKLRDVPSMNYTSKDKPFPRGEICVKGYNVFKGYYKQPEKTAETLSADGWLYTGDIGMIDDQGRLRIIDRVKNIFKLSQGEYIAPDKLEIVYNKHEAIQQSFIYGDSLQSTLVAIIVPTIKCEKCSFIYCLGATAALGVGCGV
jgi:long-chain acyl-CoA synthetase